MTNKIVSIRPNPPSTIELNLQRLIELCYEIDELLALPDKNAVRK